ncbi:hypothetical protein G4B88_008434 [Cannabis sativa]|uniref:Uncharacterized protein n=1 Tax=Cannabis sativa TaxID=3483 RepID=A0A7J6ENW2_CANSA|nr:hypothetical protein G4B88_008434 [Cannabis sativa]
MGQPSSSRLVELFFGFVSLIRILDAWSGLKPKLPRFCSRTCEFAIKARLPGILSLIYKSIDEIEREMDYLGRPVAVHAGAQLYTILELYGAFDRVIKEDLDGGVTNLLDCWMKIQN